MFISSSHAHRSRSKLSLFISARVSEQETQLQVEIRRRQKWLRKELKARETAREMFLTGALTSRELSSIMCTSNSRKAADLLLTILLDENEREIHQRFLEALQQTKQNDVYDALIFRGLLQRMFLGCSVA